MQDNLFLHFIALICTWLNAKFHAKYTLKQIQGNKFLVQNSAKIRTKVQKWTGKSLHYKPALNSQQLGIIADKNASKPS